MSTLRRILFLIFFAVFVFSAAAVARYAANSYAQKRSYQHLVELAEQSAENETAQPVQPQEPTMLARYEALYRENDDLVGWIKIDGTNINYPVVQSKDAPNFYLKHDFEKNYTDYGCPYAQQNCDVQAPSDNVVLYGHNMKDGTMFCDLTNYKSESFWAQHRTIQFDTLTQKNEYTVIAAFKGEADELFAYNAFVDAATPEEFDAYVAAVKELALYDTGISATYGDKLITLSTCEYSFENGRMVVVAKRTTEAE